MQKRKLDIILPCFNPPDGWADTVEQKLKEIYSFIKPEEVGLILVNDGSKKPIEDAALAKLKELNPHFKFKSYPQNRGKGFALREGVRMSESNFCIYTDIDFPYTADSFASVLKALEDGGDVVISKRSENYYEKTPFLRKIISKVLKSVIRVFLKLPTTDTQAGLKGFNLKGKSCFLDTKINRYLFDLEFVYLAARKNDLNKKIVNVELRPDVKFSKMHTGILIGESLNFFRIIMMRFFR